MTKADLVIDWASQKAAAYACRRWHYTGCTPRGKLVKVGAWERGRYIGCVIFARGATPRLGRPYGLAQTECVELGRVALAEHDAPVSRIVAIAVRFLKRANPGIRLIVSFADRSRGHHGGIYQAGNWIYTGKSQDAPFYWIHGRLTHKRSIGSRGLPQNLDGARQLDPNAREERIPGKHRYLMPLDDEIRRQVEPLSLPYPRKGEDEIDERTNQSDDEPNR